MHRGCMPLIDKDGLTVESIPDIDICIFTTITAESNILTVRGPGNGGYTPYILRVDSDRITASSIPDLYCATFRT